MTKNLMKKIAIITNAMLQCW